mmetsp:Transcript_41971/g.83036  ORF Transcript_41971/g.83036 Transcript_41971/m.83036 type:complete len:122 (+) Transcript_41971:1351-1716(+)
MRVSKVAIWPAVAAAGVIEVADLQCAKTSMKLLLAVRITAVRVSAKTGFGHIFAHDRSTQVRYLSQFLRTMGKAAVVAKCAITVGIILPAKLCLVETHFLPLRTATFLHDPMNVTAQGDRA